mmetsp:Transcript_5641/g.805  ORF Transcript_5641/g.805 Transcript_5641/m.805 type:complete len:84 (-) Transcript_5641:172-423(-)
MGIPSFSIIFTVLGLIISSMGTKIFLPSKVNTSIGSLHKAYFKVIFAVYTKSLLYLLNLLSFYYFIMKIKLEESTPAYWLPNL